QHRGADCLQEGSAEGACRRMPPAGTETVLLLLAARLAQSGLLSPRTDRSGRRPARAGELAALSRLHEWTVARAPHELRRCRGHLVRWLVGQAGRRLAAGTHVCADSSASAGGVGWVEPSSPSESRRGLPDVREGSAGWP